MRRLVPLDMHKATFESLVALGLPDLAARRLLKMRALWMLTMHKEDISKIHIADLRSVYQPYGLDMVELQALWHWLQRSEWFEGPVEKVEWMYGIKNKLRELDNKAMSGRLTAVERRDPAYKALLSPAYLFLSPVRRVVKICRCVTPSWRCPAGSRACPPLPRSRPSRTGSSDRRD